MPPMLSANMEAINRYFMETAKVKTKAAEKIKQEWMKWWKDNRRSVTWYDQEEYDIARNMRNRFDLANTITTVERADVERHQATGLTSEEAAGGTRRAGTSGMYVEEEEPLIPTKWKVGAALGIGLIAIGVFGKKLLGMTPAAKLAKFLP